MDSRPLVVDEIAAGAQLIREFSHYAPVKVAFWLKQSEDDYRYLYLASDQISESSRGPAYGELIRITDRMPSFFVDPSRVNLISSTDRLALAALQVDQTDSAHFGTKLQSQAFGGSFVSDAYIYPPTITDTFPRTP